MSDFWDPTTFGIPKTKSLLDFNKSLESIGRPYTEEEYWASKGFAPLSPGSPVQSWKPDQSVGYLRSMIAQSAKPEEEETRINTAWLVSQTKNLSFADAYRNLDEIIAFDYNQILAPKDALHALLNVFNTASANIQIARLNTQLIDKGYRTAEEYLADPLIRQVADLEKKLPPYDPYKRGIPFWVAKQVLQVMPSMIESWKEGQPWGLAAAAGVAALAVATGGVGAIGATALTSSGLVSTFIPTIVYPAYQLGSMLGSAKASREIETGSMFQDIMRLQSANGEKLNPVIAADHARVYGVVASVIETLNIGDMSSHFLNSVIEGADSQLVRGAISGTAKSLADKAGRAGKAIISVTGKIPEWIKDTLWETTEEDLQQFAQIVLTEHAKQVENKLSGFENFAPATIQEIGQEILATTVGSLVGFGAMKAVGRGAKIIINPAERTNAAVKVAGKVLDILGSPAKQEARVQAFEASLDTPMPVGTTMAFARQQDNQYVVKANVSGQRTEDGKLRLDNFLVINVEPAQEGDSPGTVTVERVGDARRNPQVVAGMLTAAAEKFPGWKIEWNPQDDYEVAIRDAYAKKNPLGTGDLQYFNGPMAAQEKQGIEKLKARLVEVKPEWDSPETLNAVAWSVNNFAKMMGMDGDTLVEKAFAPEVFGQVLEPNQKGPFGASKGFQFGDQIKTLVEITKKGNPVTAVHEFTHGTLNFALLNRDVPEVAAFLTKAEAAFGVKDGDWDAPSTLWTQNYKYRNRTSREAIAYALEDYIATGNAPTEESKPILKKLAEWVYSLYSAFKGARVKMNEDIVSFFDSWASGGPVAATVTSASVSEIQAAATQYDSTGQGTMEFQGQAYNPGRRVLSGLERAKSLEMQQAPAEEIRAKTGWFKDSGEWRFDKKAEKLYYGPAQQDEQGWVYKAEQVIAQKMQGPMSGKQVLTMLNNAGVKQEELSWTGLDAFLDTEATVTPAEVRDYIDGNKLQIVEIKKGHGTGETRYMNPDTGSIDTRENWEAEGVDVDELEPVVDNGDRWVSTSDTESTGTRWGEPKYNVPGGTNYRELVITLPSGGKQLYRHEVHWPDIWNPIGHIRGDDRITSDGKRMFFAQEIQSDWQEAGRKEGYRLPDSVAADMGREYEVLVKKNYDEFVAGRKPNIADQTRAKELEDALVRRDKGKEVPPAPFSKTWPEFLFKRLARMAAEQGYDSIGWTTGQQQAERYDLSKQVDEIVLTSSTDMEGMLLEANKDGRPLLRQNITSESEIEKYIGKEATKNLLAAQETKIGPDTERKIAGESLKVGGEGMKGFYDKIIVDFANKFGKKFGVQVEDAKIAGASKLPIWESINGPSTTVHSLPITPEMRESVMQGQPLFQGQIDNKGRIELRGEGFSTGENTTPDDRVKILKYAQFQGLGISDEARQYVNSGATYEEFKAAMEAPDEGTAADWGLEDLAPEQKEKFYREAWDAANKPATDSPALTAWIQRLEAKNYAGVKELLSGIWEKVILGTNQETLPGADAEEVLAAQQLQEQAKNLQDRIDPQVLAGSQALGARDRPLSTGYLNSIYQIIKAKPELYAAVAGVVTGDQVLGDQAAAAALGANGIEDLQGTKRMSLAERTRMARQIRDEGVSEAIRTGTVVVGRDVKEYVKRLNDENTSRAERIKELDTEIALTEAEVDNKTKTIGRLRTEEAATQREIKNIADRIEVMVRAGREIPEVLQSKKDQILKKREAIQKNLTAARDWVQLGQQMKKAQDDLQVSVLMAEQAKARGEQLDPEILLNQQELVGVIQELKGQMAETARFRDDAKVQTYLAKLEERMQLQEHQEAYQAQRKAAKEFKSYRDSLAKTIMGLPSDAINYEQAKAIMDIQKGINPHWISSATQEKVDALRAEIADNPDVLKTLNRTWAKRVIGKSWTEFTLSELEELADKVDTLRDLGRTILAARNEERLNWVNDKIDLDIETVRNHPKYKEQIGVDYTKSAKDEAKGNAQEVDSYFLNARRKARDLDGYKDGVNVDLLITQRNQHWTEELVAREKADKAVAAAIKKYLPDMPKLAGEKIVIADAGPKGGDVTLSHLQLMGMAMALRDEQSGSAAVFGNLFTAAERRDMEGMTSEEKQVLGDARLALVNQAIEEHLTKNDWGFIDEFFQPFFEETASRLAPAVGVTYNKVFEKVQNYFPMFRMDPSGGPLTQQLEQDFATRSPGNRKSVKKGHTITRINIGAAHQNPIELDIVGVLMKSIPAQEHLIAFAEYAKRLDMVYADPVLKSEIVNVIGVKGMRDIQNTINTIKNPDMFERPSGGKVVQFLRGNVPFAYLGLRIPSVLKQVVTSPWPALQYTSPSRLFTEAVKMMSNPAKYIEEVHALSPILRNRQYSIIQEYITQMTKDSEYAKYKQMLMTFGMKGLELADKYSVAIGYKAIYDKYLGETGNADEARAKADQAILDTQPSSASWDLAPLYQDKNPWKMPIIQFTQALNVIYGNIRSDLPAAVRARDLNKILGTLVGYMVAGTLLMLVTKGKPEDDEDAWKYYLWGTTTQFTDAIPIIGQDLTALTEGIITGHRQPPYGDDNFPAITKLFTGMDQLTRGQIEKGFEYGVEGAGMLFGLPTSSLKSFRRLIEGDYGTLLGRPKGKKK